MQSSSTRSVKACRRRGGSRPQITPFYSPLWNFYFNWESNFSISFGKAALDVLHISVSLSKENFKKETKIVKPTPCDPLNSMVKSFMVCVSGWGASFSPY